MRWKDIQTREQDGKIIAAKITVYSGDDEEYFSFITPEAYYELERWMKYREDCGENIDANSWLMRQLWDTKKGYYHHGTIKDPLRLQSSGIKRLMEDALWTQGVRKKTELKRNRYEFQTDHGLRKWFKTRCEISGMKSINIEKLMGHSIGISDSYYKVTENELLNDYLKTVETLTICNESQLKNQVKSLKEKIAKDKNFENDLKEKMKEIDILQENYINKDDAIASLSDKIHELMIEIERLKR